MGVVVRAIGTDGAPRYLIVKPKGKGDDTPYVLPRGTRMYRDPETGTMIDARDEKTATKYADFLEDMRVTAARELEEEAGVPHAIYNARNPIEIGEVFYDSPSKGRYPIMWFAVNLQVEDIKTIRTARDSVEVKWMTLAEYEAHARKGHARVGYADIIKRAERLNFSQ